MHLDNVCHHFLYLKNMCLNSLLPELLSYEDRIKLAPEDCWRLLSSWVLETWCPVA